MRPVVVAGVEVHEHIIGDIEDIELPLESLVVCQRPEVLPCSRHHGVPGGGVPIDHLPAAVPQDVPLRLVAAEVLFAVAVVRALVDIEDAPEQAV